MEGGVTVDNKTYISSKEAALRTGYAQDYIGQLCRGRKIVAKRMGRTWFIEEASLLAYMDAQNGAKTTPVGDATQEKSAQSESVINLGNSGVEVVQDDSEGQGEETEHVLETELIAPPPPSLDTTDPRAYDTDVEEVFVSNAVLVPVVGVLLMLAVVGFSVLIDSGVVKRSNLASAVSPYNSLAAASNQRIASETSVLSDIMVNDTVHISSQLHGGIGLLLGGIETVQMMTEGLPEGARLTFVPADDVSGAYVAQADTAGTGIVVVPSGGEEIDRDMIEYIQSSFSDEVIVTPNEDGASGIVQPVFRDRVGADYLYVLVPVRE